MTLFASLSCLEEDPWLSTFLEMDDFLVIKTGVKVMPFSLASYSCLLIMRVCLAYASYLAIFNLDSTFLKALSLVFAPLEAGGLSYMADAAYYLTRASSIFLFLSPHSL